MEAARFLVAFGLLLSPAALANPPYHANVRFENTPPGEELAAFAIDASGNVFTAGYLTNAFGQRQIRAEKFDATGNSLGSFEFAGMNGLLTDSIAGVAVDPNGNLVIAGTTDSATLASPVAFVVKLDAQLKTLLSSTMLGVNGFTMSGGLTVDRTGNIYVTGQTQDSQFPTTPGAFQSQFPTGGAVSFYAFITKLAPDGKTILFSTLLGSRGVSCTPASIQCLANADTLGRAVALDASGDVIVAGITNAERLPFPAAAFSLHCGDCGEDGSYAGFVVKFSSDGTRLLAGTYIPVTVVQPLCNEVGASALAVDLAGNIVVAGMTSGALPVTAGALQTAFPQSNSGEAGFVLKFDPLLQQLIFGTYFGGSGEIDQSSYGAVSGLTIDAQGTIWVTGVSPPEQLPSPAGTPLLGGAYLAGLSADGSSISALFAAPPGFAGLALVSANSGVAALGPAGALLTATSGAGPSLLAITNSAGFAPSTSVAPYELISLYGLGIGPSSSVGASIAKGVIRDSLDGVQVLFDGIPAPLLYAGPAQINAVVPSEIVSSAAVTIEVVTPDGTLVGPAIRVSPSEPGVMLSANQPDDAILPVAAALNQDGTINSAANPAAPGSILSVWVSGAGLSTYQVPDGTVRSAAQTGVPTLPVAALAGFLEVEAIPTLPVGALSTEVVYAGDAAGMVAGVTQVNFLIPLSVDGIVPSVFSLQIGEASSQSFTVYIGSGGATPPIVIFDP